MSRTQYEPLFHDNEGELEQEALLVKDRSVPPIQVRPPTYYGDGPFDAPSSDEEDELLEKGPPTSPGIAERGNPLPQRVSLASERPTSLRLLVIALVSLVALSGIIGIVAAHSYVGTTYHAPGVRKITMDHVFNGTFSAERRSLAWVPEAGDGVFSIIEDGYIKLVDLKTNTTKNLVYTFDVKSANGLPLTWASWKLSPDMKYILVKSDHKKLWRWSSFGNYYIHEIATKQTTALIPPTHPPTVAYATWSPTGESIAYVTGNDLYILPSPTSAAPIRLTTTGSTSLFNGVPSWVYEEEILSAPSALWFSPASSKLAFLTFDESLVDEFTFPIYNPTEDADTVVPYTADVTMKYPKPGFRNPLVEVAVFDLATYLAGGAADPEAQLLALDWAGRHDGDDSVVSEIKWVSDDMLVLKEVNRNADNGSVVLFEKLAMATTLTLAERARGTVVRKLGKDGEEGDEGWIDNFQNIYALPSDLVSSLSAGTVAGAYIDVVPTPEGFNHLALFSPPSSSTPIWLTSGAWEVTKGVLGIDAANGIVYFEAANPLSTSRHLYSVPLPSLNLASPTEKAVLAAPKALTGASEAAEAAAAYYAADFSPQAGFYLLSYMGPGIPSQKVVKAGDSEFEYVLTTNARLGNVTEEYEAASVVHSTIEVDGYELNVKEIRPPRMDDSGRTKYPVLFRVYVPRSFARFCSLPLTPLSCLFFLKKIRYGGPFSQLVDLTFARGDWHEYLACGHSYVIVVVDGRGTGHKGRKLRNPVKGNLGFWETRDQVAAARIWAAKDYVDPQRIGIWGWSYGGFMSAKVVEADAGIHSLAMSVAPVTSWRLYDSIYTERYMNLPALNPGGYINASISNVTAFRNVDYLLAHGSADDNVHFANSAHLLDMFTKARVRNFRFRMFTDSDHGINRRGAQREVYEYMTGFLLEKWGKGGGNGGGSIYFIIQGKRKNGPRG
ncbi:dipeptidyl aminopeptidase [Mycena rosella]|uniref:Dipeptidyl aminopeptidase n=1 Tax=Mycena rosella TaxID=1033263 RepID=A0AAD7GZ88_MYCRO|nr:dipeptidyl aminopeptidase [Mycena rosella]